MGYHQLKAMEKTGQYVNVPDAGPGGTYNADPDPNADRNAYSYAESYADADAGVSVLRFSPVRLSDRRSALRGSELSGGYVCYFLSSAGSYGC